MGRANAFAVVSWNGTMGKLNWLMKPARLAIPSDDEFSLEYVLTFGNLDTGQILSSNLVIGVDAPLGFPSEYSSLVAGAIGPDRRPNREIDSSLGYRATERWVFDTFGKKPLSAPFDRLGNNATLAIATIRRWKRQYGFAVLPFDDDNGHRVIIEVYPKLLEQKVFNGIRDSVCSNIPAGIQPNTDEYDACLAALNAIALRTAEGGVPLPRLVGPTDEHIPAAKSEGWIFCFQTI